MMAYKILGISGSPKTQGNVGTFLDSIMNMAAAHGLETETICLSQMNIKHCVHCNFCMTRQKDKQY